MRTHRVTVINGPLPQGIWERPDMEPQLATAPEHMEVMRELMQREPLFHRPEFGTTRKDFEKMTAPAFWEVGASGRRYSRQFVLDVLEERYAKPTEVAWEIGDFHCFEIATDNYLVSYTLIQGERVTRRTTIWRRTAEGWQTLFHQGTIVTP
ncbi:MAG TPA: hypothetical protein VMU04_11820 [Candidatus Acidoferrum sp.]|nr:hypothetical protein [Candidatus Acidoferrum sp.]